MELILGKGSEARLKRIQELKGYDELQAIEYAISVAWLVTERKYNNRISLKGEIKKEGEQNAG